MYTYMLSKRYTYVNPYFYEEIFLDSSPKMEYSPVLNTYRKAKWLNLPVCGNFSHFCFLRFVVRKPYPEIFLIFLFSSFGW